MNLFNFLIGSLLAVFLLQPPFLLFADEIRLVESSFCPLVCDPEETGREGILVDMIKQAFKESGHTATFKIMPFARALKNVAEGRDHGMPGIYKTDAPDFIFTKNPIVTYSNSFFVTEQQKWRYTGGDSWKNIRVGVVLGYTFGHRQFDRYILDMRGTRLLQESSGTDALTTLIKKLFHNRIDAFLDAPYFVNYTFSQLQKREPAYQNLVLINAGRLNDSKNFPAFSPKDAKSSHYAEILDEAIDRYKQTGAYEAFFKSYGVYPPE